MATAPTETETAPTAMADGNGGVGNGNGNGNLQALADDGRGPERPLRGMGEVKHIRPHILVAVVLAIALASGWHNGLRNALADIRFAWLSQPASGDIVVIAIDAPSIEKIGVWPWPRRLHAELLDQLERAGARHRFRRRLQHAVGPGIRSSCS